MSAQSTDKKPSLFSSLCQTRCPRCRRGNMFVDPNPYHLKRFMKMYDQCPVCGQHFDLEVGFYYGTGYVSYALTIAVSVATLVIWALTIGLSVHDTRVLYWLIFNGVVLVVLQPYLMRLARTLWLFFFVGYDPRWREKPAENPERINNSIKNDW